MFIERMFPMRKVYGSGDAREKCWGASTAKVPTGSGIKELHRIPIVLSYHIISLLTEESPSGLGLIHRGPC